MQHSSNRWHYTLFSYFVFVFMHSLPIHVYPLLSINPRSFQPPKVSWSITVSSHLTAYASPTLHIKGVSGVRPLLVSDTTPTHVIIFKYLIISNYYWYRRVSVVSYQVSVSV